MSDRHVRRNGSDYAEALLRLLPWGQAWPRHEDSTLVKTIRGLASYWGFVDGRAADLLEIETDPRLTMEMLPDWERNWGLPDPCFPESTTIEQRRAMLMLKMTLLGGQSRAFFTGIMKWLGYDVVIKEFSPFMAGISRAGDTRPSPEQNFRWYIGPPEMRFYWTIFPATVSLVWFRAGQGEAGVDHHLEIGLTETINCLLERWKPAHTDIVMDTSSLALGGPMQGTP